MSHIPNRLWSLMDIAAYMNKSRSKAKMVVAQPGFPLGRPCFRLGEGGEGGRLIDPERTANDLRPPFSGPVLEGSHSWGTPWDTQRVQYWPILTDFTRGNENGWVRTFPLLGTTYKSGKLHEWDTGGILRGDAGRLFGVYYTGAEWRILGFTLCAMTVKGCL